MALTRPKPLGNPLAKGAAADGADLGHGNPMAIREHLSRGPPSACEPARACGYPDRKPLQPEIIGKSYGSRS